MHAVNILTKPHVYANFDDLECQTINGLFTCCGQVAAVMPFSVNMSMSISVLCDLSLDDKFDRVVVAETL